MVVADRQQQHQTVAGWLMAWLPTGFVEGQHLHEAVQAMNENGFDLPNAWVCPVHSELIELNCNIGAGHAIVLG